MSNPEFMARAAEPTMEIIRNVKPDQLDAPTPCADWTVRKLINHLLYWGPALVAAARKESTPFPDQPESEVDLTAGDWAAALEANLTEVAAAWNHPAAWQGTTRMGEELPADLVGGMAVGEVVVHGWDLATATGQRAVWDRDLLEYLRGEVARSAAQGREMGVYGPEITVPDTASTMDQMLGLTGRDPVWTP